MIDVPDDRGSEAAEEEGAASITPPPPPSDDADALAVSDADEVEAEYRELLDDPNVRKVVARFLSFSEMTTGSVPPPSFLREYEVLRPGAAVIVFERYQLEGTMARDEQMHRHAMDRLLFEHDVRQETKALAHGTQQAGRGQWFGFLLAILFLAAAVFVMWYGMKHDQPGVAATGGGAIIVEIVGVVVLFLRERSGVTAEMAEKRRLRSNEVPSEPQTAHTRSTPPTEPSLQAPTEPQPPRDTD